MLTDSSLKKKRFECQGLNILSLNSYDYNKTIIMLTACSQLVTAPSSVNCTKTTKSNEEHSRIKDQCKKCEKYKCDK